MSDSAWTSGGNNVEFHHAIIIPSARGGSYASTLAEVGRVWDALRDYAVRTTPVVDEGDPLGVDQRTMGEIAREATTRPDVFADVLAFSRKFGHHVQPLPAVPPARVVNLRIKLVMEEFVELLQAICNGDLPGIADGGADLMYVVIGTLWAYGIDGRHVWNAVQRANLSKSQSKRGDGKTEKGENFVPPDVAGILARQQSIAVHFQDTKEAP